MSRPDVEKYLTDLVGESQSEDGTYSAIDFRAYALATGIEQRLQDGKERNVAVIVASGQIVDGEAAPGLELPRVGEAAGEDARRRFGGDEGGEPVASLVEQRAGRCEIGVQGDGGLAQAAGERPQVALLVFWVF